MSVAFGMLENSEYEETAKFCKMFDRFFDCMNTRDAKEGKQKRKPDLDPYRSVKDKRFDVSFEVVIIRHDFRVVSACAIGQGHKIR